MRTTNAPAWNHSTNAARARTRRPQARWFGPGCAAVLVALAIARAAAQDASPHFGAAVEAVELYVSVTTRAGDPVSGLPRGSFHVLEDGVEQDVTTFVEGDFPLALAIAVDRSWSMAGRPLQTARAAGHALLDALAPTDQAMVVAISGAVEIVAPLSSDRAAADAALDRLDPWSTTALYDAIVTSLDQIRAGRGRRALVLVTDGVDRYSQASADDVLARARRSGVMVFPVVIGRDRPEALVELAAVTGGRIVLARDRVSAGDAVRAIARDLRHQYLLGYTPRRPFSERPEQWRSVSVRVDAPETSVRTRDGYYPPRAASAAGPAASNPE